MKKYNVLKVVGISFLLVTILTWIIPAGSYSTGTYEASGTLPFGIFDLSRIPLIAVTNLIQFALVILVIGGFYGVLNKTGVYTSFVLQTSKKYKGKEKHFVVLSILIFSILAAVVGAPFAILLLLPFFGAVILLIGYNKMTAMLATIGAMLLGNLASIFNTEVATNINQYLNLGIDSEIFAKIILLLMLVVLYVLFVLRISKIEKVKPAKTKTSAKKEISKKDDKKASTTKAESKKKDVVVVETKEKEKGIPLYNEKAIDKKKSFVPLLVIFVLILVISLVALFDWTNLLKFTHFETWYEKLIDVKVGNYPIMKNILGTLSPFGYWTNYELIMFLLLTIPFIAWLYNVKLDDMLDGFVDGAKEVLKPAVCVLIATILYASMFNSQTGANIFYTIVHFLLDLSKNFNGFVVAAITAIGGFLFSDFSAFMGSAMAPITSVYTVSKWYPLIGMIVQTIYGLVMFIGPSSILLILGLSYFDISYKDWFKTIIRYLWKVLLIIILVMIIIAMFI